MFHLCHQRGLQLGRMHLGRALLRNTRDVFQYHIEYRVQRLAHMLLGWLRLLRRHTDSLQPVHHQRNLLAFGDRRDNRVLLVQRNSDLFRGTNPVQSAFGDELHKGPRLRNQHCLVVWRRERAIDASSGREIASNGLAQGQPRAMQTCFHGGHRHAQHLGGIFRR